MLHDLEPFSDALVCKVLLRIYDIEIRCSPAEEEFFFKASVFMTIIPTLANGKVRSRNSINGSVCLTSYVQIISCSNSWDGAMPKAIILVPIPLHMSLSLIFFLWLLIVFFPHQQRVDWSRGAGHGPLVAYVFWVVFWFIVCPLNAVQMQSAFKDDVTNSVQQRCWCERQLVLYHSLDCSKSSPAQVDHIGGIK